MALRAHLLTSATLAGLAVLATDAGCSGQPAQDTASSKPSRGSTTSAATKPAEPAVATSGPGVYTFTDPDTGAAATFTVPAPADDPDVAKLEAARAAAGAPAAYYVLATLDGTTAAAEARLPDLSIVDSAGSTADAVEAWQPLGDWQSAIGADGVYGPEFDAAVDEYNALLNRGSALPGAKTATVLVASTVPADVARVFAKPSSVGATWEPMQLAQQ